MHELRQVGFRGIRRAGHRAVVYAADALAPAHASSPVTSGGCPMPLRPIGGKIDLPVVTAQDVQRLFEFGVSLDERSLDHYTYEQYQRDLADYLDYIGAIVPEYFRPLQEAAVTLSDPQLRHFAFCTFETWLYLLRGAPDTCVEHLARRLGGVSAPSGIVAFVLQNMLASICTPTALQALAEHAKQSGNLGDVANTGFWIPPNNAPAVPRFTPERQAAQFQPFTGTLDALLSCPHPVGLPITTVMGDPSQQLVTWHYCSFGLDAIAGLPRLDVPRLHLVSPPLFDEWTLYCDLAPDGRYEHLTLASNTEADREEMQELRRAAIERQSAGRGQLVLLPFDDRLVYSNGHVELTPGVVGTVGGPPIGLYPNPCCPSCGKLMFHVATLGDDVRQYGDGFRSLFICEDCERAACHATGWN